MKKLKNVMLLAVMGLASAAIVTTSSCKKSNPANPVPTISAVSPTSGADGDAINITGTNLLGATVTVNGAPAVVGAGGTANSITITVPAAATIGGGTIVVTTAYGSASFPFTVTAAAPSSNDVAAANLIAHWTFDGTNKEAISNTSASTSSGVTTNAAGGQIGGYAAFADGYLLYPTIPNINVDTALAGGFTFTTWAKLPADLAATHNNLLTSLWQINSNINDIWGTAAFTYRHAPDSTLDFDGTITHVNGGGTASSTFTAFLEGAASGFKASPSEWEFITMAYDTAGLAATGMSTLKYYGNGVLRGSKTTTAVPAGEQLELITTNSFGGTGRNNVTFGSFNYSPVPFAAGGGTAASWQNAGLPAGSAIDDTRLFNKTLTQAEITELFTRGSNGH